MPTKTKTKKVKFTPLATKPPQLVNKFGIVLDASGSMSHLRASVVDAFNANVANIAENAKKMKQTSFVRMTMFPTQYNATRNRDVAEASNFTPLTLNEYSPMGGTPLFDSVGEMVSLLQGSDDGDNVSYVVMVLTDGEENSSLRYNKYSILNLIKDKQATDRWTFVFLCPTGYGQKFADTFGIPPGNIQEWEATVEGTRAASYSTVVGTSNYFVAREKGARSVSKYFTTDMSKVSVKKVQQELDDISDVVKAWKVEKEGQISDFVRTKNKGNFKLGAAYYQLMKPELIQFRKQLLLMEKGKKAVYAGEQARTLLGLPNYDVKVVPGNHANFDIFVQSTSNNRKVVRGTTLLYRTDHTIDSQHTW